MDVNDRRGHVPAPALTGGVTLGLSERNTAGGGECVWTPPTARGYSQGISHRRVQLHRAQ